MEHVSVLKEEVQNYLDLEDGWIVVDATLGLGGHSLDILKRIGKTGTLIAFEQDERNLQEASKRLEEYKNQIHYISDNFRYLKSRVTGVGIKEVDAILFDLGLSSPHVDEAERGFSFMKEGPLDMRFDQRSKRTAYDVINSYSEEELARVIYEYAEDPKSRKLARQVCQRRKEKPFETTTEFAEFINNILPKQQFRRHGKLNPATKYFQAIRMEVNSEMEVLKEALEQAMEILKVGGRIAIISYHSLEDRLVKHFFKDLIQPKVKNPEEEIFSLHGEPIVNAITKKPVIPSEEELKINPRSRSAKLRVYEKLK